VAKITLSPKSSENLMTSLFHIVYRRWRHGADGVVETIMLKVVSGQNIDSQNRCNAAHAPPVHLPPCHRCPLTCFCVGMHSIVNLLHASFRHKMCALWTNRVTATCKHVSSSTFLAWTGFSDVEHKTETDDFRNQEEGCPDSHNIAY
jgi:hypothetical protein